MAPYERSETSRLVTMTHAADLEADAPSDCHVVLTIPAKPEYVALSRLAVAALGGWADLQADDVADLKVAVTDACAMLLASHDPRTVTGGAPALELAFDLCDERWMVKVTSLSPPEDVATGLAGSASDQHDLGMAVIRALVDEVEVVGDERYPTALTLIKTVR